MYDEKVILYLGVHTANKNKEDNRIIVMHIFVYKKKYGTFKGKPKKC